MQNTNISLCQESIGITLLHNNDDKGRGKFQISIKQIFEGASANDRDDKLEVYFDFDKIKNNPELTLAKSLLEEAAKILFKFKPKMEFE